MDEDAPGARPLDHDVVRMSRSRVAIRYVAFAAISTLVNLGTQEAVVLAAPGAPLLPSLAAGTIVGFVVKYALDKWLIFYDPRASHREEARKVVLYGLFSVATTAIFWACEILFWTLWQTATAKYSGAILGLAIGYAVKFWMDRSYVFTGGRMAFTAGSPSARTP